MFNAIGQNSGILHKTKMEIKNKMEHDNITNPDIYIYKINKKRKQ